MKTPKVPNKVKIIALTPKKREESGKKEIRHIGIPEAVELDLSTAQEGQVFSSPRLTPIVFIVPLPTSRGVFVELVGIKAKSWHYPINGRTEARIKLFPREDELAQIHIFAEKKGKRFVEIEIDTSDTKSVKLTVLRDKNSRKD